MIFFGTDQMNVPPIFFLKKGVTSHKTLSVMVATKSGDEHDLVSIENHG